MRSFLIVLLTAALGCLYERPYVAAEPSVAAPPPPPAETVQPDSSYEAQQPPPPAGSEIADEDVFTGGLAPYGTWTYVAPYGRVWIPAVGWGWRPWRGGSFGPPVGNIQRAVGQPVPRVAAAQVIRPRTSAAPAPVRSANDPMRSPASPRARGDVSSPAPVARPGAGAPPRYTGAPRAGTRSAPTARPGPGARSGGGMRSSAPGQAPAPKARARGDNKK